jgi:hypothetical protein
VLLIVFYLFLVKQKVEPFFAFFATLLFAFNKYLYGMTVWNYFQINDVIILLILVLIFNAMYKKDIFQYALLLLLSVFVRETAIITIPVFILHLFIAKEDKRKIIRLLLYCIPAVLIFFVIRKVVPYKDELSLFKAFMVHKSKFYNPLTWYRLVVNAFAPVTLIFIVFYRETFRIMKENKALAFYFVLVFITTVFGNNNERLMAPAFIPVYFVLAKICNRFFKESKFTLVIILIAAVISSFHHFMGGVLLPGRNYTLILSMLSMLAVTAVSIFVRIKNPKLN